MGFDGSRVRRGEWIVGVSGLVLLASTFLLNWYGLKGRLAPTASQLGVSTSLTGWSALSHVRWLLLVVVLIAFALLFFQARCSAPAIPVTLSVIVTVLGLISVLALIWRVLLDPPAAQILELKAGGIVAVLSALALTYGGYLSLREEGVAEVDAHSEIETVRLPAGS